jgi:FKBP-type peptidyl-prolyl cis-trans isomerase
LVSQFEYQKTVALEASKSIPVLEAALIPAQHDLAAFQLQDTKLNEIEQRILESDLKDALEECVVEKYRELEYVKKEEKRRKAVVREQRRKKMERAEEEKRRMEKDAVMEVKNEKMKVRLTETLENVSISSLKLNWCTFTMICNLFVDID